ncbi:MAG: type II secretion system F family protein [Candidatus Aenigmatarchaeota archaeon]
MANKEEEKTKAPEDFTFLKMVAIKLFGRLSDRFFESFTSLKQALITSNAKVLFRTYLSLTFFVAFITFIATFIMTLLFVITFKLDLLFAIFGLMIVPLFFASITFFMVFVYPFSVSQSKKTDLEVNLPFALTHMAAIAESGAPPLTIFKILAKFNEYGELSKEANEIARNVELFGLDEISALKDCANKTSSSIFKDVLEGMIVAIQSGGSLKSFLVEEANRAMLEYTIKREKYNEVLSTYADIYTALLIAAPMIFIVVLAALNIMGGGMFGFTVQELMVIGTLSLATLNMIFLTFLSLTQPKM